MTLRGKEKCRLVLIYSFTFTFTAAKFEQKGQRPLRVGGEGTAHSS